MTAVPAERHERWRPSIFGVAIVGEPDVWFYINDVWQRRINAAETVHHIPRHLRDSWYQGDPLPPPQPDGGAEP